MYHGQMRRCEYRFTNTCMTSCLDTKAPFTVAKNRDDTVDTMFGFFSKRSVS